LIIHYQITILCIIVVEPYSDFHSRVFYGSFRIFVTTCAINDVTSSYINHVYIIINMIYYVSITIVMLIYYLIQTVLSGGVIIETNIVVLTGGVSIMP